jgi:rod shape-determining protein MreC
VYDRKTVRRRRAVLGLFVACSLILLTAYFGDGGGGGLHRGVLSVLSPIQEGANRALKPVRDLGSWVGETFEAKGQVEDLRAERDALRRRLTEERGARQQNEELRGLLDMRREAGLEDQGPVTARVIGRSPNLWYAQLTVNKGSGDGVRVDQPVVSSQGLVGTVKTVTGSSSVVRLITDPSSGVSARIAESGVGGILQPAVGRPRELLLEFIDDDARVRRDQTVVTAGLRSQRLESLFPPGIPVGRVLDVDGEELELFRRVRVEPFADLRSLEFVEILTRPEL